MNKLLTIKPGTQAKEITTWQATAEDIFGNNDPLAAIGTGKTMAKAWSKKFAAIEQFDYAQNFVLRIMESFWSNHYAAEKSHPPLPFLFKKINIKKLDKAVAAVADAIGSSAAKLSVVDAGYLLGNIYTSILPDEIRSSGGIFYTPPSLTKRLIELSEKNGVNWATAKVIDPACGGGAFLAPVCLKIIGVLKGQAPEKIIAHIQSHVLGWEIDPFAGWMTQVFVEITLKDFIKPGTASLQPVVKICDSLQQYMEQVAGSFDLVIGNPPYGKLKLTDELRCRFKASLYGHANLYGIFTQLAIELAAPGAVVAYLTPTSFLSGEYFKNLRQYIRTYSAPIEIDFVSVRKGVFEDVLQETMLAVYKKSLQNKPVVKVNQVETLPRHNYTAESSGNFRLPVDLSAPWILPRLPEQTDSVNAMKYLPHRLIDWGYTVSTGPLVWNRHKKQLSDKRTVDSFPLVWAESITSDGRFNLKADKINHEPYFRFQTGDEWLVTRKPCILLQRTTAKEQDKRLIAATIPLALVKKGVVIENHLNMIIAVNETPKVEPAVLSLFLNSKAVNRAFRAISGSVAISAYELESLPLPSPDKLLPLAALLAKNADQDRIEKVCGQIYLANK